MTTRTTRDQLAPDLRAGAGLHEVRLFLETRRAELEDTLDDVKDRLSLRPKLLRAVASARRDWRRAPQAWLTGAVVIAGALAFAGVYTRTHRGDGRDGPHSRHGSITDTAAGTRGRSSRSWRGAK